LGRIDFKNLNTRLYLRQRKLAKFIKERRTIKLLHLVRNYSAFAVVVSSALLVSATNASSGKGTGSFLFGYWDTPAEAAAETNVNKINGQINKKNDLAMVPLSKASTAVDPGAKIEEINQAVISGQSVLSSAGGANPMKDPEQDGGVNMYVVQTGDTLGSIAAKNKVSINTILWANDISNVDQIKPGDTLFILPVSGIQYAVKAGDNIDGIAAKFKADKDKIISFNDLPANGDLTVGEEIVIPDGQGEAPSSPQTSTTPKTPDDGSIIGKRQYANATGGTPEVSSGAILGGKPGTGHRFPYGYCTWYVAQKRNVPWGGNAGTWIYHAKAGGYATGRTPKAGAIVVTTENRYYGHVAYVEKVSGGTITVSEMNYVGFGKVSRRTLSASDRAIKGFIY
jgi:surface antigen/LysM repeat protein